MNWPIFAVALGALYVIVFVRLMRRHGWSAAAALTGILHLVFAIANSAAPFRALVDGMYMGWQIGLLRFEGRSAVLPSAAVLAWALVSLCLCAVRPASRWMRLVAWGDVFWMANISAATLLMLLSGQMHKASIQLGEYFQIGGLWVGVILLIVIPLVFGSSAIWAYGRSAPSPSLNRI